MDLRFILGHCIAAAQAVLVFEKMQGHIDWSWWVVLLMLWAPIALGLTLWMLGGMFFVGCFVLAGREGRNQYRQHKRIEALIKSVRE